MKLTKITSSLSGEGMPSGPLVLAERRLLELFSESWSQVLIDHKAGHRPSSDLSEHVGDRETHVDSVEREVAELDERRLP
jgi:hypothetical protein